MEPLKVVVGEPAPFKVPDREGCLLEIGYPTSGMNILVQYPNLSRKELEILQSNLVGYSYYESETVIPIAYWIFQFSKKMFIETNFNACLGYQDKEYMETINYYLSDIRNSVSFFYIDRNMVKGLRIIGLHVEAIHLFHKTINKQLSKKYSKYDFNFTMKQMENAVSSEELYKMGTVFSF